MSIERATYKGLLLAPEEPKRKAVSRTIAGNIALRWSAGLGIHSRIYKHSVPPEPGSYLVAA